ncbi:RNA polymerase sigma factor [Paludisphaera rhizosphaerae]|uniref:RNA polymerase sigma factor n=1 Tax=Paludisphaera rhizosphaerae TaxID=2711216 RepID=UPI0013ED75ED|nr:RNA polymerase sigma factor [Paludisphaera rhizosphaerae]
MLGVSSRLRGVRAQAATTPRREASCDGDDFALAVRPLVGDLVRLARRRLGSEDMAWEAVQDALFNLWSQPVPPPNPRAWLIRAVLLRCLHIERTVRRRRRHESAAGTALDSADDRDDPARRAAVAELWDEVRSALEGLADDHRAVLILHLIEGLDYRSIALRLGVPTGTVRSRLSRAREALRARLCFGPDDVR